MFFLGSPLFQISDFFTSLYFWVGVDLLLGGAIVYEVVKFRGERSSSSSVQLPPQLTPISSAETEMYLFARDFDKQIAKLGATKCVVKAFQVSLNRIIEKYDLKSHGGQTDLELIEQCKKLAQNHVVDTLARMYSIYEPMRFGNKQASESDVAIFKENILVLTEKLREG